MAALGVDLHRSKRRHRRPGVGEETQHVLYLDIANLHVIELRWKARPRVVGLAARAGS
jgi:hypothetical protein